MTLVTRREILRAGLLPTLRLAPNTIPFTSRDGAGTNRLSGQPGYLSGTFIYEEAPFPSCHASTIVEAGRGLVAAWFGGSDEGNPDVGIWLSHRDGGRWTAPVQMATGEQPEGKRWPCWNPVLFQPVSGPLLLFYKVGPSPRAWWGMLKTSDDGGDNWTEARRLPEGILGPIKNKPLQLPDGTLLCGSSTESGERPSRWRVHFERTADLGMTWKTVGPVNDGTEFGAIQPALLSLGGDRVKAVGRTRQGKVFQVSSEDGGLTWGNMAATSLPNPNSGIDAVTLRDGRHLIVYNHTSRGRSPLNVALSDDGSNWKAALILEDTPGEFSYPAVIQTADGLVHLTYTWHRKRIKHVVLDPAALQLKPIVAGRWPR